MRKNSDCFTRYLPLNDYRRRCGRFGDGKLPRDSASRWNQQWILAQSGYIQPTYSKPQHLPLKQKQIIELFWIFIRVVFICSRSSIFWVAPPVGESWLVSECADSRGRVSRYDGGDHFSDAVTTCRLSPFAVNLLSLGKQCLLRKYRCGTQEKSWLRSALILLSCLDFGSRLLGIAQLLAS